MSVHFPFDNSYRRLGEAFGRPTAPTPVAAPLLLKLNGPLAAELGLDAAVLEGPEGAQILSGNRIVGGAEPFASAYAGHQFGNFVPQLGDGRAILLGEVIDRKGRRRDIQLKGSGLTAFSRGGDGRAALGPVLREYLVSEAMHALGVPTTRALAAVSTGEAVYRESPLPGAVLTRVAASHVRVGTFQFFAARRDDESVRRLADHVIARHYPQVRDAESPYAALLEAICDRQAALVARWMLLGFVHGVMNTDNMSVAGETIDYGPCAFLDRFDPETVFSSIDRGGRYAYRNQPGIAQWNLTRLAECLLPLLDRDETKAIERAEAILAGFGERYSAAHLAGARLKLGLRSAEPDDEELFAALLAAMREGAADFTLTFRGLGAAAENESADGGVRALFADPAVYDRWAPRWHERLKRETTAREDRRRLMDTANPAIIPRNHRVEEALAAAYAGDLQPFHRLHEALARPFEDQADFADYAGLPPVRMERYRTFCGT